MAIKKFLRSVASRVLSGLVEPSPLDYKKIEARLAQLRTNRCYPQVTAADTARFYESAKVFNLQKNPAAISIGKNSHVRGELIVFPYGGRIEMGEDCYVGEGSRIWSGESVTLGNSVGIAHNINIMDFAHETHYLTRAEGVRRIFAHGHPPEKGDIPTAPVVIEDYAAIYPNSSILRGVRIGKGAIVSTGSVVMSDVPPFTIVMGNPARVMGKLPSD